jgi:hypothetical protein
MVFQPPTPIAIDRDNLACPGACEYHASIQMVEVLLVCQPSELTPPEHVRRNTRSNFPVPVAKHQSDISSGQIALGHPLHGVSRNRVGLDTPPPHRVMRRGWGMDSMP